MTKKMTKKKHDPLMKPASDEALQRQQAAERAENEQARANPARHGEKERPQTPRTEKR
jgi:hypothetical protein